MPSSTLSGATTAPADTRSLGAPAHAQAPAVVVGAHWRDCGSIDEQRRRDDAPNHRESVLQAHHEGHKVPWLRVHSEERRRLAARTPLAKRPCRLHST